MTNEPESSVVVVGNGQAGIQVVDSLRDLGYAGRITLLGDENAAPYQRPPLSKDYLTTSEPSPLPLRAESFFAEKNIDVRIGVPVVEIDRAGKTVRLEDGTTVGYSSLVLATGAENRRLKVPGIELDGIHGLRTLADAEALHSRLNGVTSAVVVGAGFIGLEFAAGARARGIEVTVLQQSDRPMGRSLSPVTSAFFAEAHRKLGVNLKINERMTRFEGSRGHVTAALTEAGGRYPADLVLVGIGVNPRDELARQAGLVVDNGIAVDGQMRTSDPDIFAVGDCASFPGGDGGQRIRLESVQNATDQARHVARAIVDPATADYEEVPWFWSIQGTLRLQIAGLVAPGDETVLRGDPDAQKFSVFCFRDGALVAVESVNQPADHMAARRVLASKMTVTPEQAADPDFDFKAFSKTAPAPV